MLTVSWQFLLEYIWESQMRFHADFNILIMRIIATEFLSDWFQYNSIRLTSVKLQAHPDVTPDDVSLVSQSAYPKARYNQDKSTSIATLLYVRVIKILLGNLTKGSLTKFAEIVKQLKTEGNATATFDDLEFKLSQNSVDLLYSEARKKAADNALKAAQDYAEVIESSVFSQL